MTKIKKPVFVFGCCNSGTTILWQVLKQHTDLSGPEIEGQDIEGMPRVMTHFLGKPTFRLWAHPKFKLCYWVTERDFNKGDAKKIRRVYGQYLKPETRLIAKSPADTLRARLIQACFPDAYFIAMVRNGYAVSEGIIRKRKDDPERPQFQGLFTTIDEAAEQWFRANVMIASLEKYLRNYLIIRYEDLVKNTEQTFSEILNFGGLTSTDFSIPDFGESRNQKQIARLSESETEEVTRIAGPMLIHFKYELLKQQLKW